MAPSTPAPTTEEKSAFLAGLQHVFPKAAVLSSFFPHQSSSMSTPARELPATIASLFNPRYKDLDRRNLLKECEQVFKSLSVSPAEAEYLTQSTLLQSSSAVWYTQRKGRITASNFGAVCHTSITQPSRSLVDKIAQRCSVPKVPALIWGLENESKAMKEYALLAKQHHRDFELKNTGLHINIKFPHLGATPDGLISCSCCGQGVLEIKCPFSIRNASPCTAAYLETTGSGRLKRSHGYHYQVQGQLGLLERGFCDFVTWTLRGIHVERIIYEPTFFVDMSVKLERFFVQIVLPDMLVGTSTSECSAQTSHQ